MHDNDDIMNKIDKLHAETQDDIRDITDKIVDLDKKVDIHIAVAKVMDNNDEKYRKISSLSTNQKWGIGLTLIPVIIGVLTFIITNHK